MELLPRDMIMEILRRLTIPQLLNFCETNKYFNTYRQFFGLEISSYFDFKYERSRFHYYREMNEIECGEIDLRLAKAMSLNSIYTSYTILKLWWTCYLIKEHSFLDDKFVAYGTIEPYAVIYLDDFMFSTFPDLPNKIYWWTFEYHLRDLISYNISTLPMATIHDIVEEMNDLFHLVDKFSKDQDL